MSSFIMFRLQLLLMITILSINIAYETIGVLVVVLVSQTASIIIFQAKGFEVLSHFSNSIITI